MSAARDLGASRVAWLAVATHQLTVVCVRSACHLRAPRATPGRLAVATDPLAVMA
jgi:hypothetical protein